MNTERGPHLQGQELFKLQASLAEQLRECNAAGAAEGSAAAHSEGGRAATGDADSLPDEASHEGSQLMKDKDESPPPKDNDDEPQQHQDTAEVEAQPPSKRRRRTRTESKVTAESDSDFEDSLSPPHHAKAGNSRAAQQGKAGNSRAAFEQLRSDAEEATETFAAGKADWQARLAALDKGSIEQDVEARAALEGLESALQELRGTAAELLSKRCAPARRCGPDMRSAAQNDKL